MEEKFVSRKVCVFELLRRISEIRPIRPLFSMVFGVSQEGESDDFAIPESRPRQIIRKIKQHHPDQLAAMQFYRACCARSRSIVAIISDEL
jgi:hypothetical protein